MDDKNPAFLEVPLPGVALLELLDKQLLIQLRDGRKIIGMFRSFDQFANLVVESSVERIIVGEQYCDVPLGVQIIRGENVVILGEIDPNAPPPPGLTLVPHNTIKQAIKAEKEATRLKKTMMARMDFLDIE